MKRLIDFKGQEHITSVLRASVIKSSHISKLAISGDESLAVEIATAYQRALNCKSPIKGDACNECVACNSFFVAPRTEVVTSFTPGFTNFTIRKSSGVVLNKDIIRLVLFAVCGDSGNVIQVSEVLSKYCTFDEFVSQTLEVFRTILYLNHNLAVAETENLELLRKAAPNFHPYLINNAMRLLWEEKPRPLVSDELAIQTSAMVLAHTLYPVPSPSYISVMSSESERPIKLVEESTGQTLDIAEMLRIANE